MDQLTLSLLGGFEARTGSGSPVPVSTKKAQALLAYLALTPGQSHPRDKLAALLWADTAPGPARKRLVAREDPTRMASNDAVIVGGGAVGVEIALDAFAPGRLAR